jgi:hypothetical protein
LIKKRDWLKEASMDAGASVNHPLFWVGTYNNSRDYLFFLPVKVQSLLILNPRINPFLGRAKSFVL